MTLKSKVGLAVFGAVTLAAIAVGAHWLYGRILSTQQAWVNNSTWCLESPECRELNDTHTAIAHKMALAGSVTGGLLTVCFIGIIVCMYMAFKLNESIHPPALIIGVIGLIVSGSMLIYLFVLPGVYFYTA